MTARAADPPNNTPDAQQQQGAGSDDGLASVPVNSYLAVGTLVGGKQRITRLHLDLDLRPQPQQVLRFPAEHLTRLSVTLHSSAETDRWLATVDPQWPAVESLQVQLKSGPRNDAPRTLASLQHLLDRFPHLRRLHIINSGRDADWRPIVPPNTLESLAVEGFARHDGLLETLGNSSVKSLDILRDSGQAANADPSVTEALTKWPGAQNLTSLSLANCLPSSAELTAIPQLEALEELNLYRAEIAALAAFPHLKRLRLSECALSPQALRDFAGKQALEQAVLLGCSVTAEFDVDSLPRLSEGLESLTIGRADTVMPIWKLFDRASDPTRLTAVGLRHIDIPPLRRAHNVSVCTACNDQFLQFLSSMDRLDSLMLVTDTDLGRVARIMSLPGLEELELNFPGRKPPQLDEEVVRRFTPSPRLKLLSMDCSGNLGGLSALAGRIPTLTALRLRPWGTPGIQLGDMNNLAGLKSLKSLDLGYCVVAKDAIQAIGKFEGLERLDLAQSDLRDDELRVIAELPRLRELSLAFNTEVTSEGFASLQFGKYLKVLDLADVPLPVDVSRQIGAGHFVMGDAEWPTSRGTWLFGRDIWSRRVIGSDFPGLEDGTLGGGVGAPQFRGGIEGQVVQPLDGKPGSEGGVADVILWLVRTPEVEAIPALIENTAGGVRIVVEDARWTPRVTVMQAGTPLFVENHDDIDHDGIPRARRNDTSISWDFFDNVAHRKSTTTFSDLPASTVPLTYFSTVVDPPFQKALLFVAPTASWAISDANGRFQIDDLPAGRWTFQAWHEKCGYLSDVTAAGEQQFRTKGEFRVTVREGVVDLGRIEVNLGE